jgi:hypothetical protein
MKVGRAAFLDLLIRFVLLGSKKVAQKLLIKCWLNRCLIFKCREFKLRELKRLKKRKIRSGNSNN